MIDAKLSATFFFLEVLIGCMDDECVAVARSVYS